MKQDVGDCEAQVSSPTKSVKGQQTTSTAKAPETALCKPKRRTTECRPITFCGVPLGLAQSSFSSLGSGTGLLTHHKS